MTRNEAVLMDDICALAGEPLWSAFAGKTLFITGATGLLGAHAALAALKANERYGCNIKVVAVCRNKAKALALFPRGDVELIFQDIREPFCYKGDADYIFHFAGAVGPAVFADDPVEVLSGNAEGTLNLLRFALAHHCKGFAFASTHEVYGNAAGECREDTPLVLNSSGDPRSCYILAKQFAENALACYTKQYGLKTVSLRFSRVIGTLMNLDSGLFLCGFIKDQKAKKAVEIRGNPKLLRPLCYVTDAVKAVLYGVIKGEGGNSYNVQGAQLPTILEIAEEISDDVRVTHPEKATANKAGHWLNCDKIRGLGWKQEIALKDGIRRTVAYYGDERN